MVLQLCVAFDQRDQTTPGSDVACSVAGLGMVGHIFLMLVFVLNSLSPFNIYSSSLCGNLFSFR